MQESVKAVVAMTFPEVIQAALVLGLMGWDVPPSTSSPELFRTVSIQGEHPKVYGLQSRLLSVCASEFAASVPGLQGFLGLGDPGLATLRLDLKP